MTQIEKIYLLDRLHHLIRRKGTGNPKALADRLDVSERTVYNLIDTLRGLGIDITYCKDKESYCYEEEVVLNFLPVFDEDRVKGGVASNSYLVCLPLPLECNSFLVKKDV
jgi:hypothetical protein